MRSVFAKTTMWCGLLFLGVGTMGCCKDQPRQFDTVTITLDNSLRDASNNLPRVEVNLVAANDTDVARWMKVPVTQYFQSPHETNNTVVVILGQDAQTQSVSAKSSDPASRQYMERIYTPQGKNLVILCDYPPPRQGPPSDDDPRRLILPLICKRWPHGQQEIKIGISPIGLTATTPPLPPE